MKRTVQTILRIIAAGLIVIGTLSILVDLLRLKWRGGALNLWSCLLGAITILLGVALSVKAPVLAGRLTDDFDQ